MAHPSKLINGDLTYEIIGAFYEVYNTLGYGLSEKLYMAAMAVELSLRGFTVEREVLFDVFYKGTFIGRQRVDMIVDKTAIVEGKAADLMSLAWQRQLLTYLNVSRVEVGVLLHFGPRARFLRLVLKRREGAC